MTRGGLVSQSGKNPTANYVWDTNLLDWVAETQPGGGSGGGGAATIADGADVTQGAKGDSAWDGSAASPTAQGILKYLGAKIEAVRALLAGSIAVTGTFWQAAQPVTDNGGSFTIDAPVGTPVFARLSDGSAALVGQKVAASSIPVVVASDQGSFSIQHGLTGATNVFKTGTITSSAVTADQVVLTYTVTALKTFYLQYLMMYGRLTTLSATASILGAISLETPSGTKVLTLDDVNPTTSEVSREVITFSEPQPIAAGTVIRVVVTPAATTSMLWRANFGGYEK